jgi:hypothetical protein
MLKIYIPIIGLAILSGCAGGGGGGGGSGLTPAQFRTPEYNTQYGLGMVNAADLFAKGGNGSGVKVAVFDSGINPVEAQTGSSISIDTANSFDYVSNRSGSASDGNGHGTHVAGIIAAPKNDSGMHGIAFNATLLNLRISNSSGTSSLYDSQLADGINRSLGAGAMILNNSWGFSNTPITSYTLVNGSESIAAYQNFVARGGVVVFAAGNDGQSQVSLMAGLPYRFSGLSAGWLAVMAVDAAGNRASYSNACGVAKAWCLAAPGTSIYSMYNNGGYATLSGTSMAAPMVSGALASLKGAFPNLSYQQIRDRLLVTANKTGIYANQDIYGQGLMDLNAAANPVGGLAIPMGSHTSGSIGSVSNSTIALPSSVTASMRDSKILLVDNFQKAPFWASASSFVKESRVQSNLAVRHMSSMSEPTPVDMDHGEGMKFTQLQGLHSSVAIRQYGQTIGFASGIKSEHSLSKQLGLQFIPHLNNSMTNTNGFGYATNFGKTKVAVMGSLPNIQSSFNSNELNQDRSVMGSRNAFSFVSQREHENFVYGVTYSVANSFTQPLGLSATGAFGLNNSQATSMGGFYSHSLFEGQTKIRTGLEMANFNTGSRGLTSFDSGKYAVLRVGADHSLSKKTALSLGFKQEQALSGQLTTRLPSSIDENGNIGYQSYASGFNNFLNSHQLNFDIHHRFNAVSRIKGGLIYEQKPYGPSGAGAAIFYEHRL